MRIRQRSRAVLTYLLPFLRLPQSQLWIQMRVLCDSRSWVLVNRKRQGCMQHSAASGCVSVSPHCCCSLIYSVTHQGCMLCDHERAEHKGRQQGRSVIQPSACISRSNSVVGLLRLHACSYRGLSMFTLWLRKSLIISCLTVSCWLVACAMWGM